MEEKFYRCKNCGKVFVKIGDTFYCDDSNFTVTNCENVTLKCCTNEPVKELKANTVDAAVEKHIPVYTLKDNKVCVTVGEVLHPMTDAHYIEWICLITNLDHEIKYLKPNDAPYAEFELEDEEKVKAVYAYCNLHGLWQNN